MKKLNFLLSLAILALASCAESSSVLVPVVEVQNLAIDYTQLIVGKWQQTDIGKMTTVGGQVGTECGEDRGRQTNQYLSWETTNKVEQLEFAADGSYKKLENQSLSCTGNFKAVKSSPLVSISGDCGARVISVYDMNKTEMVLVGENGDYLRYARRSE